MIEVNHLRKVYGDTVAVDDVSFEVPEGEILGFLGPNGAGKSTTMRILTGFTPASGGRAVIGGFDVSTQSRQVRSILGYLPESAPVYGEMTVRGYVDFFAEVKGLGGVVRRRAVDLALEECGLTDVAERMLKTCRKGTGKRAALAQAVVGDPAVCDSGRADCGAWIPADSGNPLVDPENGPATHGGVEHAYSVRGESDVYPRAHHSVGAGGGDGYAG
jgi:ABC-2 type transport system ATP-binding protein